MKHFFTLLSFTLCALSLSVHAEAAVEWQVLKEFTSPVTPLDVAISPDATLTYVLGEKGQIYVYAPGGVLRDTFQVAPTVDRIKMVNDGQNLLLTDSSEKKITMISVAFQADIDTTDSPFLGKAEAPIVISVFSDFQ